MLVFSIFLKTQEVQNEQAPQPNAESIEDSKISYTQSADTNEALNYNEEATNYNEEQINNDETAYTNENTENYNDDTTYSEQPAQFTDEPAAEADEEFY